MKNVTIQLRKEERKKWINYIKFSLGHTESKDLSLFSVTITKYLRLGKY